jgi:integrase
VAVKLRERKGKGWYVLIDWRGQRKAKFFGDDKKAAKVFTDKLTARLKWAEQSGEPLALSQSDQAMPTVKAYLEDWLKTYAEVHCKSSTVTDYRHAIDRHIVPAFGNQRLHEVTRADVKRLIASLVEQGLKKQTVHNVLAPFKEAYNHAIDEGLVTLNPAARTGRLTRSNEDRRTHISPLTGEEVRAVLGAAQEKGPMTVYPILLCAVRTGMREGELIGLQWEHVDFRGGFIEVRQAVVRRRVTTTKTHKIRRVDLSPQLHEELQRLKEIRELEAMAKGQAPSSVVFLSHTGKRWADQTLRRAFTGCLQKAEIRQVRFHDLRHTFASLLMQQGANPKYIQEQLGHGSIQVTMDIYGHLFAGDHRHMVSRLDDPQDERGNPKGSVVESATQAQPGDLAGEAQNRISD